MVRHRFENQPARGWPSALRVITTATALILASAPAHAQDGCPPGDTPFAPFYADPARFTRALAATEGQPAPSAPPTGLIVPHHLEIPELIAGGIRLSEATRPDRIVVLFPDHFFKLRRPFATTGRGFDTVLGPVPGDPAGAAALRAASPLMEDSCLFARDHGLRAVLPFIAALHPGVPVLPVAVAISSTRPQWEDLATAMTPLAGPGTLMVQATDFSHYLPLHEARQRDQQVLNLLAAGDLDAIAGLRQPDHVDSLGAMYVTLALQQRLHGAAPVVVANRNLQELTPRFVAETTSYITAAFLPPGAVADPIQPDSPVYMLGGDLFLGRSLPRLLADELAADRVAQAALAATRGRPLVLNLEGVLLPDLPGNLPHLVLASPAQMVLDWARRLNVVAFGLANNHTNDIGLSGVAETLAALRAGGMAHMAQGAALDLPGVTLVALSDLDGAADPPFDRLGPGMLDRLVRPDAAVPVVAFVHWGREYVTEPGPREVWLADQMRRRGVAAVVGAHPHAASAAPVAIGGGDTLVFHSTGNFLFDQLPPESSGALVELRAFAQGTVFLRQMPLPHLFAAARGR
ncbi:AmmeMemoRadiSam system protein B [Ruixingdingia sedimenti]|uniref:AmmeMemoRadiSam system protein B n=1 Tax=Ruixingdingia sedimenti TaxID=3073604 RepID=A0ABU1F416_9RHOB|nr:AmmeMemoRadiSam system protein B [Xinfangfangia sp. LG-4]MDR5651606.1 AmmeMemoRadiSam system protein B [Xinfangfangia sp. LG-4]